MLAGHPVSRSSEPQGPKSTLRPGAYNFARRARPPRPYSPAPRPLAPPRPAPLRWRAAAAAAEPLTSSREDVLASAPEASSEREGRRERAGKAAG